MNEVIKERRIRKMQTNELEKQIKSSVTIKEISFYTNFNTIKALKTLLDKEEKKAIKEGYTNLRLDVLNKEGYDYEGASSDTVYLVLLGDRLETEEEWHSRLLRIKTRKVDDLEDAKKMTSEDGLKFYENEIDILSKALEKSTLRCEKCNCLCSYTTSFGGKKARRICSKCADKICNKNY